MEAAESILRAGYRLDRYELLCPIATGGMATVWLARLRGKRGFEKLFAIKTIRTELVDDPRFQEMFLDEARIASGIQHPNVAQILDLGEQQDVLFIVMEWVDGDSLAKVRKLVSKRGHRLPTGVVLRVLADASAGVHAAHEMRDDQGEPLEIVHRDVSLQNILVGSAGSVKVIDFGIAKAHNRKQGETRTGVVKGKIQYMAPEQVQKGKTVDRRTDVWALGVCLHELVTGKLPYDGDDDIEVIRKLMTDEAPLLAEGLPDPIVRVLERSIALEADSRFPTAAGMQRALEAAMKELGEATTSEDVAAFLRTELPELAQKRKEILNKAVEEARERVVSGSETTTTTLPEPDVAFAPTVMSERQPKAAATKAQATPREGRVDRPSDAGTVALVTKKDAPTREPPQANDASALDQEPIKIPKTSKAWLWLTLLLIAGGAGAWYRWPNEIKQWLAARGIGGGTDSPMQIVPVPGESTTATASASAASTEGARPPTATATAPSATTATTAAPQASPHPSASASASSRPEPSATHHTWPAGHEPPASSAGGAPSAAPTSTWSPYKTPGPAATGSDNPYQAAPPL
ncbi:MAG TPA: serine/threonine-protein kinase [Polyangiaceae bacterium]|jgi:serine/threonine-protein kinase